MREVLREVRSFGASSAPFRLREVRGARRITVHVTHEGVVVTKPRWVSRRAVEQFLRDCDRWIERELAKRAEQVARSLSDRVLYLGREREIRRASAPPVRLAGDVFWAVGETPRERLTNVLDWMKRRAKPVLRERTAFWSERLGVVPARVGVRDQVSRWGSCSDKGSLSFNWRLIMAPPEVLEYIVVHELAHIREHNHSRRFWSLVAGYCPEYALYERWLDEHNDRIMVTGRGGA